MQEKDSTLDNPCGFSASPCFLLYSARCWRRKSCSIPFPSLWALVFAKIIAVTKDPRTTPCRNHPKYGVLIYLFLQYFRQLASIHFVSEFMGYIMSLWFYKDAKDQYYTWSADIDTNVSRSRSTRSERALWCLSHIQQIGYIMIYILSNLNLSVTNILNNQ